MDTQEKRLAPLNEEGIVVSGSVILLFVLIFGASTWAGLPGMFVIAVTMISAWVRTRMAWWLAFVSLASMCIGSLLCMFHPDWGLLFFCFVGYLVILGLHLSPGVRLIHKVYL